MQRRSSVISGCINFPVNDPAWKNNCQGGMFVKLVVCDNRKFANQFGICSGAQVYDILAESLIADDRRPSPEPIEEYASASVEAIEAEQRSSAEWEAYHFPRLADPQANGHDRFMSRDYLAVLVLGTTGWSGWHVEEERSWNCQFDDLNEEGKSLYRQMQTLYEGCEIHLLTFLDS